MAVVLGSLAACGGAGNGLEAPKASPGGVTGVLFVDRDHDGNHDRGEPALADWRVGIYADGPIPQKETTSDADGRFRLANVKGLAGDQPRLKFAPYIAAPGGFDQATSAVRQRLDVDLGDRVLVPVDEYTPCRALEDCEVDLPDLVPVLDIGSPTDEQYPGTQQWYLDTEEKPGRVLLRFASMTSNLGTGLLHVVALDTPSDASTQPVQQRLYGDHTVFTRTAGDFVYHHEHKHFHLDDFETYELRPAGSPDVVATGSKVSFCLTDIAAVPGHRARPSLSSLSLDLRPLTCGKTEQGISAGFTDYYGAALPDQWVDVTDVPSGDYELVLTSDPDNHLIEADETNNTLTFPLHYTNPLQ